MRARDRKVKHPWFAWCDVGYAPFTFCFNKPEWGPQDAKTLAEWEVNDMIVRAHGGRMIEDRYRVGREHQPPLTKVEIDKLRTLIEKAHPDLVIFTEWNGEGHYTVSFGARAKS